MLKPPFESSDTLQQFLLQSTSSQFQKKLGSFSLAELINCLDLIQSPLVLESQNKLKDLFKFVESSPSLELFGKKFTPLLFINYLNFLIEHPNCQNRLNHILLGLAPETFSKSLDHLLPSHLEILKHEGVFEPLQYLLTQFIHEGENLKLEVEKKISSFNHELLSIQFNELDSHTLDHLKKQINQLRNDLINYLERTSNALVVVWNTNRIDQIEKLSIINESIQHHLKRVIGHPSFENKAPTGLYLFMEQTLAKIFDSPLTDDDSSIEGMTKFTIWHLKDYWELGLLPSIQNIEELEPNSTFSHEKERKEHHLKLISLIQRELDQLDIGTVKALKKHHLYSKSLLKSYIDQQRRTKTS